MEVIEELKCFVVFLSFMIIDYQEKESITEDEIKSCFVQINERLNSIQTKYI